MRDPHVSLDFKSSLRVSIGWSGLWTVIFGVK